MEYYRVICRSNKIDYVEKTNYLSIHRCGLFTFLIAKYPFK